MVKSSERVRTGPKQNHRSSEQNRTGRNEAEYLPFYSERTPDHTLTVREVQEILEKAGVGVTERTITKWCRRNNDGIPYLDGFKDPNDRQWYITPRSVEFVIQEEQNKLKRKAKIGGSELRQYGSDLFGRRSEQFRTDENEDGRVRNGSESPEAGEAQSMESRIRDLEITNRAKDYFIDQLQTQNKELIESLNDSHYKIGKLENRLLQLEGPKSNASDQEKPVEPAEPPEGSTAVTSKVYEEKEPEAENVRTDN